MTRQSAVIAFLVGFLAGCGPLPPRPDPPLAHLDLKRPQDALDAACEPLEPGTHSVVRRVVLCELPGFLTARDEVIDTWGKASELHARLEEAEAHSGVDAAVAARQVAVERQRADREAAKKWTWAATAGALGTVVGVVGTVLVVIYAPWIK